MIRVLPGHVVDRIAAGEVVERPASVAKELVENALDAGATEVSVEFASGGVERLEVADDGMGMDGDEALLALERHATSKIESESDLLSVGTFGFRGEALPSIASVSRMTLLSRARGASSGTSIRIEGGRILERSPAGVPEGTRVRIEDLFFNTPARLKFLKTERTETARLLEIIRHLALTHPCVAFSALRDGVEIFSYAVVQEEGERVSQVMSRLDLHGFVGSAGGLTVRGYLAGPASARAGAGGLVLLVNGRPVTDRSLAGSIAAAHEGILPPGRYPQGVVYMEVPHGMVDVNVHPQKRELRFSDPRAVTGVLYRTVSGWARSAPWTRPAGTYAMAVGVAEPAHGLARAPAPPGRVPGTQAPAPDDAPVPDMPLLGTRQETAFSSLEVIGQVLGTFIVCEGPDRMVIVDQHAAAERVTFERLRDEWRTGSVPSQLLLVPQRIEMDPVRAALVEENEGLLGAFGIGADVSGPEVVTVREVPALLSGVDPERLLEAVLDELQSSRGRLETLAEQVLSTMACHASIRGGDAMDVEAGHALLTALDRVDWAHHCPHGRPVSFEIPRSELERRLGRRG
ncbi:MAG: DNA mismatch repair endonuclease MutL [Deltaproteobacteria bacterium]|nr:DNA mismatch repair endonuclease MutL [Deltaproteobacteria bacterium]